MSLATLLAALPLLSPDEYLADRKLEMIASSSVCISLATFTLVLRFIARRKKKAGWAIDDWLVTVAVLDTWLLFGLGVAGMRLGMGRHLQAVYPNLQSIYKLVYVYQIFTNLAPALIKLSILFFYKRIFVSKKFVLLVHILIGIIIIWALVMTIIGIFSCIPIRGFWTREGRCLDLGRFIIGHTSVNIITHLAVWALPLRPLWKLQLPPGQKAVLMLIFMLGLFDCAAAIARLFATIVPTKSADVTWDYAPGFIWTIVELSVGIMCACLPTIRVILVTLIPNSWRSAFGSTSSRQKTPQQPKQDTGWPRVARYGDIYEREKHSSGSKRRFQENEWELSSVDIPPHEMVVPRQFRSDEDVRALV